MLKPTVKSGILKAISTLLGLVVAILLARKLGTAGYGTYSFIVVLSGLFSILVQFGTPALILRETSSAMAVDDHQTVKDLWFWAARGVLILFILCAALLLIFSSLLEASIDNFEAHHVYFVLALLLFSSFSALRSAALRGLNFPLRSQIPEFLVKPVVLLAGALLLGVVIPSTSSYAVGLHVLAVGLAFLVGTWLLSATTPKKVKQIKANTTTKNSRAWWIASGTMAFTFGLNQLNNHVDIMMLGTLMDADSVGIYRIAFQCSALIMFGLTAATVITAPLIARAYRNEETLQPASDFASNIAFLFGLPIALVFFFFAETILSLVFGERFSQGSDVVRILVLSQLTNCYFGVIVTIQLMTKSERLVFWSMLTAAVLNMILNAILIPTYGIEGAAFASTATVIGWNIHLWYQGRRNKDVDSRALRIGAIVSMAGKFR